MKREQLPLLVPRGRLPLKPDWSVEQSEIRAHSPEELVPERTCALAELSAGQGCTPTAWHREGSPGGARGGEDTCTTLSHIWHGPQDPAHTLEEGDARFVHPATRQRKSKFKAAGGRGSMPRSVPPDRAILPGGSLALQPGALLAQVVPEVCSALP